MDDDEHLDIKAKMAMHQMTATQKDIDEFNNLGSKNFGIKDVLQAFVPFALLLISTRFVDFETDTFYVVLAIVAISSFVQGMVRAESIKVNRRIDLLLKIIKQEHKQKNT
jgi:hypothetical protein